jgi:hypothetical protein
MPQLILVSAGRWALADPLGLLTPHAGYTALTRRLADWRARSVAAESCWC